MRDWWKSLPISPARIRTRELLSWKHCPIPAFYEKAVTDFCQIEEAVGILEAAGARYRGYKNRRGLIGATAAVASELPDQTSEILVYRKPERFGTPRNVDRASLFAAEEATFPHTWDTVEPTMESLSASLTRQTRSSLASGARARHG